MKKPKPPRYCLRCPTEIDPGKNGARKYCAPCRHEMQLEHVEELARQRVAAPRVTKDKPGPTRGQALSIAEISRMARERNINYGPMSWIVEHEPWELNTKGGA